MPFADHRSLITGVVQQFGGDVDNLTDFRAICNYVITF